MRPHVRVQVFLAVCLLVVSPAVGGTMSIAWDPVIDPDPVDYRVYWGRAPGAYDQQRDVGPVLSTTLSGLVDCTVYHVAMKARDAAGTLSASFSNEVRGYPSPRATAVTPATAEQGQTLGITILGANFMTGATVRFGNPNITVSSVTVGSCSQLTASVVVGSAGAAGPTTIEVTNPDRVSGTSAGLFTVEAGIPPSIVSVFPSAATTNVPVDVQPRVAFSEPMLASTVTSTTVSLLDSTGLPVAQRSGSPMLSADRVTAVVVPSEELASLETYRFRVQGGASGVKDLALHAMASTFVQTGGFTTVPSDSAPAISSVAARPHATTAEITWTTDIPANSQVLYRKASDLGTQATQRDLTLESSHSVLLQGLAPSTGYAFRARSGDGRGHRTSSEPEGTFTTAESPYVYVTIEAELGIVSSPIQTTSGSGAFRGAWIELPPDAPTGSVMTPAGRAGFPFYVPEDGIWRVWVRIDAPRASGAAWYETVDEAPWQPFLAPWTGVWSWTSGRSYTLMEGLHQLDLGGGDPEARADRVLVTNDPTFVATEQPGDDTIAPAAPADLAASTTSNATILTWTNPASDVVANVVRYRTDGSYPTSPADGLPALSRDATSSSDVSFTHPGLIAGMTYSYAVFSVDASRNASDPAQIRATPGVAGGQRLALFSTSQMQFFSGIGTLYDDAVYAIIGSRVVTVVGSFVPGLGLDALHLEDPSRLLFSTRAGGGARHAGGFMTLKQNNAYTFDLGTQEITLFYDLEARDVDTLDALDLIDDRRLGFSTATTSTARLEDGTTMSLRPENAYIVDMTTGTISMLLDGESLGLRDLDALDVQPSGSVVFSTSTDQVIQPGISLKQQNAYAWDPATGDVRLELDGRALGLYSLDAMDLNTVLPLIDVGPGTWGSSRPAPPRPN